jgi:hypothetical protein
VASGSASEYVKLLTGYKNSAWFDVSVRFHQGKEGTPKDGLHDCQKMI